MRLTKFADYLLRTIGTRLGCFLVTMSSYLWCFRRRTASKPGACKRPITKLDRQSEPSPGFFSPFFFCAGFQFKDPLHEAQDMVKSCTVLGENSRRLIRGGVARINPAGKRGHVRAIT
ncbi:hypothetical protein BP00DRAFT_235956 [Aspergillus indologenus CBS 114.80]|uniref:Uncharacterized protein n=1 Tax=Aspergillus indologenus CBS 114.80 TaxID=1450541 RepID=A0A2V5IFP8_9EURO|nr:hypothetical protein BP00DRAFT_235956 [Aspergillus indologenus CBS 114.80]